MIFDITSEGLEPCELCGELNVDGAMLEVVGTAHLRGPTQPCEPAERKCK